jgi:hypothetical protein
MPGARSCRAHAPPAARALREDQQPAAPKCGSWTRSRIRTQGEDPAPLTDSRKYLFAEEADLLFQVWQACELSIRPCLRRERIRERNERMVESGWHTRPTALLHRANSGSGPFSDHARATQWELFADSTAACPSARAEARGWGPMGWDGERTPNG